MALWSDGKHFTTWRQLVTLAQQLGDVTEVVSLHSRARIRFTADLWTIFGSLISRIPVVSGGMNAAQRPHPGTGHQWQHAFVPWHLHSIQKLENSWNLVITYFSWPFLVWSVTNLLFGMFLGNFKQQKQRYSYNVNPNKGWVTKYSQEHFRYQQLILPWYCLCTHAPILASSFFRTLLSFLDNFHFWKNYSGLQ